MLESSSLHVNNLLVSTKNNVLLPLRNVKRQLTINYIRSVTDFVFLIFSSLLSTATCSAKNRLEIVSKLTRNVLTEIGEELVTS